MFGVSHLKSSGITVVGMPDSMTMNVRTHSSPKFYGPCPD